MAELHTTAFENFFHGLMCLRHSDFVDVRTHGNIGDLSADGLRLHDARLYACYAPEVFDASKVKSKFESDLAGALAKRPGEFDVFVFVHNDARGLHPEVTRLLSQARKAHDTLEFEQMGPRHMLRELYKLVKHEIEDLFGAEIKVHDVVYGMGLDDLRPLLDHLIEHRRRGATPAPAGEVSDLKMDYNRLDDDHRELLRLGMRHTYLIEQYYGTIDDVTERDEVAVDFNEYYRSVAQEYDAPEDVFRKLQEYVAGNERGALSMERALWVVLAYFFERCDIFREPPPAGESDMHQAAAI
ncbi:ABC-three component system protein [Micromonospora sp. CPCC 205546]|uniref:ABC-three component system protein n=1 Tax=Micromonospora sp. CPCC 205546 TaxID=3122397 RepID=UPI002FF2DA4D